MMRSLAFSVATVLMAVAAVDARIWSDNVGRSAEVEEGRAPLAELIAAQRKKVEALADAIAALRTGPGVYLAVA